MNLSGAGPLCRREGSIALASLVMPSEARVSDEKRSKLRQRSNMIGGMLSDLHIPFLPTLLIAFKNKPDATDSMR